jgi:hypothetical protein
MGEAWGYYLFTDYNSENSPKEHAYGETHLNFSIIG